MKKVPLFWPFCAQSSSEVSLRCPARAARFRGHVDSGVKLARFEVSLWIRIIIFASASTMQCHVFFILWTEASFFLSWTLQVSSTECVFTAQHLCQHRAVRAPEAPIRSFWRCRNWTGTSDFSVCCQAWLSLSYPACTRVLFNLGCISGIYGMFHPWKCSGPPGGALGSLTWWDVSLPMAGRWELDDL